MGAVPLRRRPPSGARAPGLATPTCTPPSTASHIRPTPRPSTGEKASTTIGSFCRARAFFAAHGVTRLVRVVTDNGANYRARTFTARPSPPGLHATRGPVPTPHVITARSSATTASWPRSASTCVPTPQSSSAVMPSRCGTTTTATIDPTPPAATSLPAHVTNVMTSYS